MMEGLTGGGINDQLHTTVATMAAQLNTSDGTLRDLRQKQMAYAEYIKARFGRCAARRGPPASGPGV